VSRLQENEIVSSKEVKMKKQAIVKIKPKTVMKCPHCSPKEGKPVYFEGNECQCGFTLKRGDQLNEIVEEIMLPALS